MANENESVTVGYVLPTWMRTRIKQLAAAEDRSESAVLRRILGEAFERADDEVSPAPVAHPQEA